MIRRNHKVVGFNKVISGTLYCAIKSYITFIPSKISYITTVNELNSRPTNFQLSYSCHISAIE